jgi:hypothetical protein
MWRQSTIPDRPHWTAWRRACISHEGRPNSLYIVWGRALPRLDLETFAEPWSVIARVPVHGRDSRRRAGRAAGPAGPAAPEGSHDEGRGMGGDTLVHVCLPLLRDRALGRDGNACAEVLKRARVGFRWAAKGARAAERIDARRAQRARFDAPTRPRRSRQRRAPSTGRGASRWARQLAVSPVVAAAGLPSLASTGVSPPRTVGSTVPPAEAAALRIPRAEWKARSARWKGAGDDGGGPRAAAEVAFRNAAFPPPLAGGGGSKRPRVRADTSSSLGAAARALCIAHHRASWKRMI